MSPIIEGTPDPDHVASETIDVTCDDPSSNRKLVAKVPREAVRLLRLEVAPNPGSKTGFIPVAQFVEMPDGSERRIPFETVGESDYVIDESGPLPDFGPGWKTYDLRRSRESGA
jgi:hypothetical protein